MIDVSDVLHEPLRPTYSVVQTEIFLLRATSATLIVSSIKREIQRNIRRVTDSVSVLILLNIRKRYTVLDTIRELHPRKQIKSGIQILHL